MRKVIFAFVFLLAANFATNAQGVEKKIGTSASASQIYFEAGGSGLVYTLNFDKRFAKTENGWGFRVGIGGAGGDGDSYFAIPAQVNYLLGEKGKYLELGGGITYFRLSSNSFFDNVSGSTVFVTPVIAFRSQPFAKKGITWRIAFTPFIGEGGFLPYAGASIGFRF